MARYRTETVRPGSIAETDEAAYENRYEAIGAAVLEVRQTGGGSVVVHSDACRWQTLSRICPCGPAVLEVDAPQA